MSVDEVAPAYPGRGNEVTANGVEGGVTVPVIEIVEAALPPLPPPPQAAKAELIVTAKSNILVFNFRLS